VSVQNASVIARVVLVRRNNEITDTAILATTEMMTTI